MPIVKRKVYAYITHRNRLLVFAHPNSPEAGIQVPGGTVEAGETPEAGVLREAREESGRDDLEVVRFLGKVRRDMADVGRDEIHERYFYHLRCTGDPPESWRHGEFSPSEGEEPAIPFDFFWAPLPDGVPDLHSDMGQLLPALLVHGDPFDFRISTPRLVLRDFVVGDLAGVFAFRSDPEVARFSEPLLETVEQAAAWLDEVMLHNRKQPRSAYNLAITLKDSGQLIGWIGIGDSERYPSPGELGFGYALNRAYWKRGYATEAARAIVDFGFATLGGARISAWCWEKNVASARVLEKAGLHFERSFEHPEPKCGKIVRGREFALLRVEWVARHQA